MSPPLRSSSWLVSYEDISYRNNGSKNSSIRTIIYEYFFVFFNFTQSSNALNFTESIDEQFIQKIINLTEENLDKDFLAVDFLADEMNMSRATLYRRMEQLFGESPSNFIKKYRLKKATLMLKSKKFNISEIAFKTGFRTPNYFSKCFAKEYGISPSEYLEK